MEAINILSMVPTKETSDTGVKNVNKLLPNTQVHGLQIFTRKNWWMNISSSCVMKKKV